MTVELRPLGIRCNLGCRYCYQNPQREAGNFGKRYSLEAMKEAILKEGGPFALFGGEPLLLPRKELEDLWSWGYEKFKSNSIQTNGILIDDEHIRLFRKYRVRVGISIDGPGELNDLRWKKTVELTRKNTAKTEASIMKLCSEGMPPSLIVTLHRANAVEEKLSVLSRWFQELDKAGIKMVRLHLLEVEDGMERENFALSDAENIRALLYFAKLEKSLKFLRFDVFQEIQNLLSGRDKNASCVWRACDPYTTSAVQGIEGHGQKSKCGRTNKEGIDFEKADMPNYLRYLTLFQMPIEFGGCQGCRFFLFCKGNCPGTAVNGDWRYRTEQCGIWKSLFEHVELNMRIAGDKPLSLSPELAELETRMFKHWSGGQNPTLESLKAAAV